MNRLKELRKEKGMSQIALAKELGVSYRTLQYWENGESNIKPVHLKTLCEIFDVDAPYLLGYSSVKTETDLKVAVLDEMLKKLLVIKDNMTLRESGEIPNFLVLGLVTAIAEVESFKREIENGDKQ